MQLRLSIMLLIATAFPVCAQLPETDLVLFNLSVNKQQQAVVSQSLQITNRAGYDNQPSFSADEQSLYYVSVREDKQADVYVYTFKSKKTLALTHSSESEYSPTPNADGTMLNAVVVEKDSAQRIHYITCKDGTHAKTLAFDSVGYFTFLNRDTLAYYKLTEPHSLRYHVISSGEDKFLAYQPVRGFKAINRHTLVFGQKDSTQVTFYTYDFFLHKTQVYCRYPSLQEDVIWHAQLGLLKAEGSQILRYDVSQAKWQLYVDLKTYGIKKITRFLIDQRCKRLIVVNNT